MTDLNIVHAEADAYAAALSALAIKTEAHVQELKAVTARMVAEEAELVAVLEGAAADLQTFLNEQTAAADGPLKLLGDAEGKVYEAKQNLEEVLGGVAHALKNLGEGADKAAAAAGALKDLSASHKQTAERETSELKAATSGLAIKLEDLSEEAAEVVDGVAREVTITEEEWAKLVEQLQSTLKIVAEELQQATSGTALLTLQQMEQKFTEALRSNLQESVNAPASEWIETGRAKIDEEMRGLVYRALALLRRAFEEIQRSIEESDGKAGFEEQAMRKVLDQLRPVVQDVSSALDSVKGGLGTVNFSV